MTTILNLKPLIPDFVIKLRSPTDKLQPLQDKIKEYLNACIVEEK
ncbi:MAG: Uma2 family endonuclease [Crocosphaera sp.]|nr:Uma2 family endonuclease [Crocosphaera sp.]